MALCPLETDRLSRVAELWCALMAAAQAGDVEASAFLRRFGPWAAEQLGTRQPS